MPTQPPLLLLQKTMVVVEGVTEDFIETNIWEVSRPVLEDWLKNVKSQSLLSIQQLILHLKFLREYQIFQS